MIKKENTTATFVLPKTVQQELTEIAEYEGRTLSNLVLFIVKEYLKNRSNTNKE
jgi:hypothetical protein